MGLGKRITRRQVRGNCYHPQPTSAWCLGTGSTIKQDVTFKVIGQLGNCHIPSALSTHALSAWASVIMVRNTEIRLEYDTQINSQQILALEMDTPRPAPADKLCSFATESSFDSCADCDVRLSLNTCYHTTDTSSPRIGISRDETRKVRYKASIAVNQFEPFILRA
jgi:hypothetical protein